MKYDRTVIAYHGCDADIADRLIAGEPFRRSRNDYDWLGEGIYFWEFGQHRALQFALEQKGAQQAAAARRRRSVDPAGPVLRPDGHAVHRGARKGVSEIPPSP